ncbi:DesA family fatty acid desaturase [Alkalisalibacterium limincola]|uniref:Acyl-CoA desaturase n=1 Tax=Alkalisalibacterium limincola TaxID=2699169 RepID=A0A5C8KSH4_9GAMM|nr:fatty acid desaturase [Alkalisalibacterium limincola]TXK62252.1 acyl-CoA desaturase [Alkalisalibacterium limincola]
MLSSLLSWLDGGFTGAGIGAMALYLLVVTQLTIFSVTLFLHRSQAHRGVDFHPVLTHFFRFWVWLTTAMRTKEWVAIHRKHHAHCETEEDPHSPRVHGINQVLWRGVELYQEETSNEATMTKYGRGTPDDWIERKLYHPLNAVGPTLMLFINFALFGVAGIAVWALQMVWIPFWAAGVVNGLGHWWGYRNFETADTATNLTPWAFWIGGEELHNNHHTFPSSAKFALRRWEFDIGWVAIRGFEKLGLAKVLRVAPALDQRPNIAIPDGETLKAVLTHRYQVMTDFYRLVLVPSLREEMHNAGKSLRAIPRKLRKGLLDGGRWLDEAGREKLNTLVEHRPKLGTVVEYRQRLSAIMEIRSPDAMLHGLQEWVREAEASGIRALEEFSRRLRSYALVPTRAN